MYRQCILVLVTVPRRSNRTVQIIHLGEAEGGGVTDPPATTGT